MSILYLSLFSEMKVIIIFLTLLNFTKVVTSHKECSPLQNECEYWLTVEEKVTMIWKNTQVYAVNGTLFVYNESLDNQRIEVPLEEVITADGFNRTVVAVNNTIPGPPIIVYDGQLLIIHVNNHLLSDSITIHWHGLHQEGTPFMDGVPYLTQCPIPAGQTFTYRFYAKPKGTFWYHSHVRGQRTDGLFGALIIKEITSDDVEDIIMHVGDWFHSIGSQLHTMMISEHSKGWPGHHQPDTLDGAHHAPGFFKSALIEGRGQYYDPIKEKWSETPLKEYFIKKGAKYRFRVICHGVYYPFHISVDSHTLTIVSSDGYDVKPQEFESFIINPGERYDFVITANQTIGSYWIRANTLEVGNPNHFARAILRYENSTDFPITNRTQCTKDKQCTVLNCPFKYYPKVEYTVCVRVDELENLNNEAPPKYEEDSLEMFMTFAQDTKQMSINGRHFVNMGINVLKQSEDACSKMNCNGSEVCYCNYELTLPYNKTVQMIWSSHPNSLKHHPIHLHGHSFYVLKMDYGDYTEADGTKLIKNWSIDCGNTAFCVQPTWRKGSWKYGNVPDLNLKNPPRKDTLMIPAGAYAVIRVRSNNSGKWFLHCHIEFHAMQGMAMVINEAPTKHVIHPEGFPVCEDFKNTKDKSSIRKDLTIKLPVERAKPTKDAVSLSFALGITSAIVAFVLFILIPILVMKLKGRYQDSNKLLSEDFEIKA